MRIASFNVENFFDRARALSAPAAEARTLLSAYADLTTLLQQDVYAANDKTRIVNLLDTLGLKNSDSAAMAVLRQVRGRLVSRTSTGVHVVADGRGDWVGWVELTTEPVGDTAILNTARVIADVAPDVLGVVEAEDRIVLKRFADAQLRAGAGPVFPHVMLVDGNDDRGIDVAVLTRDGWPVTGVRSHVDDVDDDGPVFSRDCPEYEIRTPGGHRLVVLVNHLKSKGYGTQSENDARRRRQAERVADDLPAPARRGGGLRRGPRRLQRHPGLRAAPAAARRHRPPRRQPAPGVPGRRPPGHVRQLHRREQDRLRAHVARAVRAVHGRRDLPDGCLGRQERHALAALRQPRLGRGRRVRPLRDLRRPHPHLTGLGEPVADRPPGPSNRPGRDGHPARFAVGPASLASWEVVPHWGRVVRVDSDPVSAVLD